MNAQELRNLHESYLKVYESNGILSSLDRVARDTVSRVGGEIGARQGRQRYGNVLGIPERIGRNKGSQQGRQIYDKAKQTVSGLLNQNYEPDAFDVILEYLVAEGYADTNKNALVIMANMSEEWRQIILELNQSDLDRESSTINKNTRNSPIQRQQPAFQQSGPQGPSGVTIPGTARAFKAVKTVGQAAVGGIIK